jgi:dienelactone hydrolase
VSGPRPPSYLPLYLTVLFGLLHIIPSPQAESPRLKRTELLQYWDAPGKTRTATSPVEWQHRRQEILQAMQQIMGPFPGPEKACSLDRQIVEEIDQATYRQQLITYASEPGSRVPAYLLIPKQAGIKRMPAVLCLHPTDNVIGHKVVVGLGGKPNRDYARELAQRGYVTLAPAYPLLAQYQPDIKELGYRSGTMKAIWDNHRGLDLLQSLPYVRTNSFGAIGHSLGGHNAIYTAVFDSRISVVISSCGFDSFLDYKDGDIRGWTSLRYMPRLLDYRDNLADIPFDFHELIAALVPRRMHAIAPLGDSNFQWQSVDRIIEAARPVYELHQASGQLTVEHPDCGHDFPIDSRLRAYQIIDQTLR